jgi:hypothetical protein
VDTYFTLTLPWVTWEAVTGVEGYSNEGYYDIRWLKELWPTQAKVEVTVLKAVWQWGRDSSVVKDPIGEPGRNPLYVGISSAWGSLYDDRMLSPFFVEELLTWGL